MNTSTKPSLNSAESGNESKPLLQAVFLAPYLPFDLKVKHRPFSGNETLKSKHLKNKFICDIIPFLKPLGDLTKDEKTCDEINEFLEANGLEINNFLLLKNSLNAVAISWEEMQNVLNILYREHYDLFGLINKGLAVSIRDAV